MQTVQLLQACVDDANESYFRFLVNETSIKYVTIAGGLYDPVDLCFAPTLLSSIPQFPDGDWNEGYIDRLTQDDSPSFIRTTKTALPGVTHSWHPTTIDYLELSMGQKLRTGVYEATSSRFPSTVVVKFARFAWEIAALDHECMAYQWIEGRNIGPKFHGLLTEGKRVIGFIMERIEDSRHATPSDLPACQQVLSQLHSLGILHGDTNKHNFLVKNDRAVLIDFDVAEKNQDEARLNDEMDRLLAGLHDESGKGGNIMGAHFAG